MSSSGTAAASNCLCNSISLTGAKASPTKFSFTSDTLAFPSLSIALLITSSCATTLLSNTLKDLVKPFSMLATIPLIF